MDIRKILSGAVDYGASDIFIIAGLPITYRINGSIQRVGEGLIEPCETEKLIRQIYELASSREFQRCLNDGDDDFSFAIPGISRFRVNVYKQRGTLSCVVRVIAFQLPDYKKLRIPESVMALSQISKGLVLVTGPAGSGKTTTLSCLIDAINSNYEEHIITLEDPIEYLHGHKKSIVSQREIYVDTKGYASGLRAALRQSPDVILLGEMRDHETMQVAMTAAETGHLILSTLHTIGAANTIDRIIDSFLPEQQHQITIQLSMVLCAVVSQQLVLDVNKNLIPVFEVMRVTPAIRNLIRSNKVPQIEGIMQAADSKEMISMDHSLFQLLKQGIITKETALNHAVNADLLSKKIERNG